MFDKILEVGGYGDWISPLVGVLGDFVNGGGHGFLIPMNASPLTGREIQVMLNRRGVKTWGAFIHGQTLLVNVRKGQARWAQQLLEQAGVPVNNPPEQQATTARTRTRATRSDIVSRSRILRKLKGGRP